MDLFQASLSLKVLLRYYRLFPTEPLNVLLSLAYNRAERRAFLIIYRKMINSIIGDSGAWSVAQGTSKLTIEEVISLLESFGHLFDRYFNFDTDFSEQGFDHNIANQLRMERAGLKPVPVIHNFFNDEIEFYLDSGKYDWLALGSSQSTNFDDIKYAVDKIKKWGNPDIKIHWFGGSKFEWLCQLPIASCDTTSWAQTGMYGYVYFWNPENPDFNKTDKIYIGGRMKGEVKGEYDFVNYPWRKDLEEYLFKTFGFSFGDLCGYDDKINMQLVNTRFFAEQEKRINDERIKRAISLD